jgi:hypothetical protein
MWWKRKEKPDRPTPQMKESGYHLRLPGVYTPIIPPAMPEFPEPPKGGSGVWVPPYRRDPA